MARAAAAGRTSLRGCSIPACPARLAALKCGRQGASKIPPFAVFFDGAFSATGPGPAQWQEYRELALARDVVSIGVIEEIGTFDLARKILAGPGQPPFTCDRDLLFGVLEPGSGWQ